ncbi:MAG: arginine--tRNA ligase, partial [Candidatus Omnitrophota bacterium]
MFQQLEKQLVCLLERSVERYCRDSSLAPPDPVVFHTLSLEIPKEKDFGDFSSALAMRLASLWRKNPQEVASGLVAIAKALLAKSPAKALVKDIEVKGAGFINIFLTDQVFFDVLRQINVSGADCAKTDFGVGKRVLLEFVSANPTGPLSVAHARQAAVGDALANILSLAGYRVEKEYYLNDEGNQINILGRSIDLRYQELGGQSVVFPEDHYQGQYIVDLARALYDDESTRKKIERLGAEGRASFFIDYGVEQICGMIRHELDDFGVHFDTWYSQKTLGRSGKIEKALAFLKKKGLLYESEGALWFKSTQFGDDKDRVLHKSDGTYTYITPDIAYHEDKFKRGFEKLINLWGPDHHGYIPRIKAAVQAFGKDRAALEIVIIQLATLFRQGQPVPMSTRKGEYVTLREVVTEVGRDAS